MVGVVMASAMFLSCRRANSPGEEGRPLSSGHEEALGHNLPSLSLQNFRSEQANEHGLGPYHLDRGRACHKMESALHLLQGGGHGTVVSFLSVSVGNGGGGHGIGPSLL